MPTYTTDQLDGATALSTDGAKLGKVNGVFLDTETDQPEWIVVSTGMFGTKEALLPLAAATIDLDARTITLPYDKEKVKGAPHQDPDAELSQQDEAELFTYYGVPYAGETVTATGAPQTAPVGHDTSGPETDDAMTRSEEQLHVGTTTAETGRARLRKYVVTEQVTQTVPVSHEEVRIEREPITAENMPAATDGPAISEEEHEVVLHGEQVVTTTEAVPVERVRLGVDTVTEDQSVTEAVRKERIETEGGTEHPAH